MAKISAAELREYVYRATDMANNAAHGTIDNQQLLDLLVEIAELSIGTKAFKMIKDEPCVFDAEGVCQNNESAWRTCHRELTAAENAIVDNTLKIYGDKDGGVTWVINGTEYRMKRKAFKHILVRHFIKYWDGTIAGEAQSFFGPDVEVSEVLNLIGKCITANEDKIKEGMTKDFEFAISAFVDGQKYALGFQKGYIGQFYPDFRKRW